MASKLHRVVARNAATASENRIHDDAVAREHGFSGGLVPGVTLYAYMTTPVVECFGRPWLERGTISVRFERPVYDGQEVEVRAEPRTEGERGLAQLALELRNPDGVVCARGEASLPESSAALPDPADYKVREAPLPEARPPADDQSLAAGTVLSTQWATVRSERAAPFLSLLSDDLPVFVEERLAHPGFLILAANSALSSTVRLGP
ncbi:MAG TPA: MaoC family dehydratase, partial [Acidimicrobiales bacterium]|nr:MaoC family dehydratase [Acidimicrobiales bacterium]